MENKKEIIDEKLEEKKSEFKQIILFGSLILFLIIFGIISETISKNNLYKDIQVQMANNDYISAKHNLEKLGNYKDCPELFKKASYQVALKYAAEELDKKNYEKALNYYKEAYSYSNDNSLQTKIKEAEKLLAQQEAEEARKKLAKDIEKLKREEQRKKSEVQAKIDKGAIYPIPTSYGKGYDQTIRRYGIANIKKINALMPKAAELVAQNPACYRVLDVDVSDERSTRNSIVMYVDCGNMASFSNFERFYVTEKEIYAKKQTESIREQMEKKKGIYLTACQAEIKSRLAYPSSYKSNLLTDTAVEAYSFQTTVNISFKAKNSFNMEIPYTAICRYNVKNQLVDISITER